MKHLKTVLAVLAQSFLLTGCMTIAETPMDFQALSGSRADGTVTMGIQYTRYVVPIYDEEQAQKIAKRKCMAWGYQDAEAFGTVVTGCDKTEYVQYVGVVCTLNRKTIEYQCLK